jgi:hypothetical protein
MPDPVSVRTTGPDGDDVKSAKGFSLPAHQQEITCCVHDVSQFHVGYGCDGIHNGPILPRSYLHENDGAFFRCYDVNLSLMAPVVPLEDAVTAEEEIPSRCTFTTLAGTDVGGFTFDKHFRIIAKGRPREAVSSTKE